MHRSINSATAKQPRQHPLRQCSEFHLRLNNVHSNIAATSLEGSTLDQPCHGMLGSGEDGAILESALPEHTANANNTTAWPRKYTRTERLCKGVIRCARIQVHDVIVFIICSSRYRLVTQAMTTGPCYVSIAI